MSSPRLITRADDAGTFISANRAILETCQKGICRNVSLMAPSPAIEHAAALFTHSKEICLGMHATITCEWSHPRWGPCADPTTVPALLAEDGAMVHNPLTIHERGAPLDQILLELDAQLERLHSLGLQLSYLDTHMPWEWMHRPGKENDRLNSHLHNWAASKGLLYWKQWGDSIETLKMTEGKSGVDGFADALQTMPDNATWLTFKHPAYADAEMMGVKRLNRGALDVGEDRDQQRRCFVDPAVLDIVDKRGIQLIRYDEV